MRANQQEQSRADVSQFRFEDKEANMYGKRTGLYFGQADPNRMKNGFARWSDYVNYDSDEISLIREEENTSLYIPLVVDTEEEVAEVVHPISAPIQIQSNKNEVKNGGKNSRKSHKELKNDAENSKPLKYQSNAQLTVNGVKKGGHFVDLAISGIKGEMKQSSSPFVVDNISDVKKRDSVNTARTSERFLLQLLQNDKGKVEEEQRGRKEEPMVIEKPKSKAKQKYIIRKNEEIVEKSKISDINRVTDRSSRPKEEPIDVEKVGRVQRQRSGVYRQTQQRQEQDDRPKSKRVTINDKGKIKLPCDSISGDYEYVLPPELRQYETTGRKRLRAQVIEEEKEEEEEKRQIPMQIVESAVQQNQQLQNKGQQKIDFDEPQQQEQKIVMKNTRKGKPVRIISSKQRVAAKGKKKSKSAKQKSKSSNDEPKQGSLGRGAKQKGQDVYIEKEVKKKGGSKVVSDRTNIAPNGQLRKKRKVNSEIAGLGVRWQLFGDDSSRSKRNRVPKLKFWQNERIVYSKQGKPLGLSVFTVQHLFQMIGCAKPQGFIVERAHPFATQGERKLRVPIRPKQKVDFSGLKVSVMRKFLGEDNIESKYLQVEGREGQRGLVKYINVQVNGLRNYTIQIPIAIKKEQFFTIENKHETRAFELVFTLKDEKEQEK